VGPATARRAVPAEQCAPIARCPSTRAQLSEGLDKMNTVLVVYPFMPHYRYGVFRALDQSTRYQFTFASDISPQSGIPALTGDHVERHVRLRWRSLRGVGWQGGLLPHLLSQRYDQVSLVGDASILSTWLAAALLRFRRVPVFFWTIGWHRPESGLKRLVRIAFYRLANHLLLYGEVGRQLGEQHGYPAARMQVISNSHVSPQSTGDYSEPALDRSKLESSLPVIGAVIRLNEVKRIDLLIRAAAELRDRGTPVTVVIAGDGPARERLTSLARDLAVDARFLGAVYSPPNIATVYEALTLTVVPAAAGLTAIQSLHHGVPVISDDNKYGQMPEWEAIKPGLTGGLYTTGDVGSLATEIGSWLERVRHHSDELRDTCRAEVEDHWSPAVQATRIEKALGDC
jgi:glycosyltransferase involved in cell wall biosynthesis